MTPSVILLILLTVVFVVVAFAFAWQEKRAEEEDVTIYSVEDSIEYVYERLSDDHKANLKKIDVRRILEWEVRWLHDPGVHGEAPVVAGGLPSAEYAQNSLARRGYVYDGPEIIEVLDLRADYLAAIGAVGEALTAAEVAELDAETREESRPEAEEPT